MLVKDYIEKTGCAALNLADGGKNIASAYTGDMLSLVISRAGEAAVWFTIMGNLNVAAVAHLIDCACVVLCEETQPDAALTEKCTTQGINLLVTKKTAYDACVEYSRLIEK